MNFLTMTYPFLFFVMYIFYYVSRYRFLCFAVSKSNVPKCVLNVIILFMDGPLRLNWYVCELCVIVGVHVVFPGPVTMTIGYNLHNVR